MSESDFKNLYKCTFEPDPKFKALDDALDSYYRESERLNSTDARILWSDLRGYARDLGFTGGQFQDAKLRARSRMRGDL